MKSNRLHNCRGGDRIRIGIAAACGSIVIFLATVGTGADEPSEKETDTTPRIDTPFNRDTMLSAEELLAENVFGSTGWTAKISITATLPDAPNEASLVGTLLRDKNGLAATLQLTGGAQRELNLLLTKERAIAWTTQSGEEDATSLVRLAKGIYLIGMLIDFPDESKPRSENISKYRLTNLGTTEDNGGRLYVIEGQPKEGEWGSARISSLKAERLRIKISASDSMPRQISAISSTGSSLTLSFRSIAINAPGDPQRYASEPPKDSFVIDLSGSPVADAAIKNPVAYNAESIARGKSIYIADCEVCHSVDGTGRDSDVTDNAADLTSAEFWLSDGSERATFLAIRDGAGDEMPGYKDDYRDEKMIWDLVNYIRSLQK